MWLRSAISDTVGLTLYSAAVFPDTVTHPAYVFAVADTAPADFSADGHRVADTYDYADLAADTHRCASA
jgi:hypothetical protein